MLLFFVWKFFLNLLKCIYLRRGSLFIGGGGSRKGVLCKQVIKKKRVMRRWKAYEWGKGAKGGGLWVKN